MRRWVLSVLLSVLSFAPCAEDWMGRVVAVHDGDTLLVMRYGQSVSVRLDEIDAPELGQSYGGEAKQSLTELCLGLYADVHVQGTDKYDRTLGRVRCGGTDVNAEQIRRGYAWFYTQYGRDMSLRELEAAAKARGIGLWSARRPQPPWVFRHGGGSTGGRSGAYSSSSSSSASRYSSADRCGAKKTCGDMKSCDEAMYYLRRCGLTKLDKNHDGVPCESLCR